jgi:hypothetical protein
VPTSSNCDSHHAQEDEDDEYNDNHEPEVVAHSVTSTEGFNTVGNNVQRPPWLLEGQSSHSARGARGACPLPFSQAYRAASPPSTGMVCPVMYEASGDARKSTV